MIVATKSNDLSIKVCDEQTVVIIRRAKWQEENKTFNVLKNIIGLKHIYNHKASAQVLQFASISLSLRSIFMLRHRPRQNVKKPLSETAIMKALLGLCSRPSDLFLFIKVDLS